MINHGNNWVTLKYSLVFLKFSILQNFSSQLSNRFMWYWLLKMVTVVGIISKWILKTKWLRFTEGKKEGSSWFILNKTSSHSKVQNISSIFRRWVFLQIFYWFKSNSCSTNSTIKFKSRKMRYSKDTVNLTNLYIHLNLINWQIYGFGCVRQTWRWKFKKKNCE